MEDHSIEDNATGDFRMKELKSSDHAAMCQGIYGTLSTCLPCWLSFQNLWSKQSQLSSDGTIAAYCELFSPNFPLHCRQLFL